MREAARRVLADSSADGLKPVPKEDSEPAPKLIAQDDRSESYMTVTAKMPLG
jgi:hypothetical protein